jgi:hypothetical protein
MSEKMVLNVVKRSVRVDYTVDLTTNHVIGAAVVDSENAPDLDLLTAVNMALCALLDCVRASVPAMQPPHVSQCQSSQFIDG